MRFLEAQGYKLKLNIMYQDNVAATQLERHGKKSRSRRNRHFDIRFFDVKDKLERLREKRKILRILGQVIYDKISAKFLKSKYFSQQKLTENDYRMCTRLFVLSFLSSAIGSSVQLHIVVQRSRHELLTVGSWLRHVLLTVGRRSRHELLTVGRRSRRELLTLGRRSRRELLYRVFYRVIPVQVFACSGRIVVCLPAMATTQFPPWVTGLKIITHLPTNAHLY